jgi:hypothetical protein
MKPEWVTAIVAVVLAAGQALNVWVTLKLRKELSDSRQDILDRVRDDYVLKDVHTADMATLRAECGRVG